MEITAARFQELKRFDSNNYCECNQTNFKIKIRCFTRLASKIFREQSKYCIIIFYNNREFERKRILVSSSISMTPTFKSSDGSQNEMGERGQFRKL